MKNVLKAALTSLMSVCAASVSAASQAGAEIVPGEFIAKLKPGVSDSSLSISSAAIGVKEVSSTDRLFKITRSVVERSHAATADLMETGLFEYVEPNQIWKISARMPISNDSRVDELWGLRNIGQLEPKGSRPAPSQKRGLEGVDIEAEAAWNLTTGDRTVVVGIIDTGIDFKHEDLKDNMWVNEAESKGVPGVDDDKNGFVDDVHGWDFANNKPDGFDDQGHGTHCAGTIAGIGGNGRGVIGVAPNVRVMAIKFLDKNGSGTTENAIKSIDYSIKMNVSFTSNSWGGGGFSQALFDVIKRAEANDQLFVAAAGNDGKNTDKSVSYPAGYGLDNIISVAALDNRGRLASFSNFGKSTVDLAAPGVNILSTVPGNKYDVYSGTSMATPHVSGAVALLLSYAKLSYAEAKKRILESTRPMSSLRTKVATGGMLNAHHALLGTKPAMLDSDPSLWQQVNASVATAHPYAANTDQTFEIRIPGAKSIALYFERFEMEGSFGGQLYDFVEIMDGNGTVVSTMFGLRDEEYAESVDGEVVRIRFRSDNVYNLYGFDVTKAAVKY